MAQVSAVEIMRSGGTNLPITVVETLLLKVAPSIDETDNCRFPACSPEHQPCCSLEMWIPRPQRLGGRFQRVSFVFLGGAGEAVLVSDRADADGVSPFACSRTICRRGQAKSSARPAGGVSGSPLNSVRAASGSTTAGREPGPPSN
jgi:hypothetical protein